MLVKATLMAALLGMALGDQNPYTPYDPVQHNFGVRQGVDIDPMVATFGVVSLLIIIKEHRLVISWFYFSKRGLILVRLNGAVFGPT